MHDAPFFFNPDERNMANAITQFRLPANPAAIPSCLISELITRSEQPLCNLNPHFFAYGQFPLYLAFISDSLARAALAWLQGLPLPLNFSTDFPSAIFWLRFYSALFSTLTVLLVYLTTNVISNKVRDLVPIKSGRTIHFAGFLSASWRLGMTPGTLAALITAFTPGLIQASHFGTTESLLTFFFLASVYLSINYLSHLSNFKFILYTSLVIGLTTGSKLTGIFLYIPPTIAILIHWFKSVSRNKKKRKMITLFHGYMIYLIIVISLLVFVISSPYNLIEPANFRSAVFGYESDVATGKYEAFYTRQFINATPITFQMEKIFPYALGWPVFIVGSIGILLTTLKLFLSLILFIIQKVQSSQPKAGRPRAEKFKVQKLRIRKYFDFNHLDLIGILIIGFWIYFIPNAFLFAKWTRFMTPILPFFAIFAGYFLFFLVSSRPKWRDLWKQKIPRQARNDNVVYLFICLFVITSILPGIMFMSIYTHEDTRVTASKWIYDNVPNKSYILSETANVVDIPLGFLELTAHNPQLTTISFDFYHLDENPFLFQQLLTHLENADYIFIPSRRIFANYMKNPSRYPLTTKYYQLLFSGKLGFEKVTEITSYPAIGPVKIPDEQAEETFTVFDHPVVRIYRKVKPMTLEEYKKIITLN